MSREEMEALARLIENADLVIMVHKELGHRTALDRHVQGIIADALRNYAIEGVES